MPKQGNSTPCIVSTNTRSKSFNSTNDGPARVSGNKARCLALIALCASMPLQAQGVMDGFGRELVETIVYSLVGIIMACIGFKVVDWLTPGNLAEDVAHKENRALAILAGSMIIGVCLIIASALID